MAAAVMTNIPALQSISLLKRSSYALSVLFVVALLSACGSSDSCSDKITLGTSEGCGSNADAVTVDLPIFYVKRPVPAATATPSNVLRIREFEPGADLYMRNSASPSAAEVNLTSALTQGLGDVRDLDVSHDGRKVVFAMRYPFQPNVQVANQLASWNIWEYDLDTKLLHRIIADDTTANGGTQLFSKYHDRFPHYSADDKRIVFTSTRQRTSQAVLLDEGKPQYQAQDENNQEPASVLHSMDVNGTNIKQLTFNQAHDMDSTLLANGQIAFARWDSAAPTDHVALYRMNPDGSDIELLYGKQSTTHATGHNSAGTNDTVVQFLMPRTLANGMIAALVRPLAGTDEGGDLVTIDADHYVEFTQSATAGGGSGPGHMRATPALAISTAAGPSPGGRFRSAYPLSDGSNRMLVSWSQCRLTQGETVVPCSSRNLAITPALPEAPPLYGLYIYNLSANTQLPIIAPQEGIIMSDIVAAAPRTAPPVILDRVAGVDYASTLESQSAGIIDIGSVYDIRGVDTAPLGGINTLRNPMTATAAQRPARFLRIEKAVSLPSNMVRNIRNTSFSPAGRFMREIIGYAPIEPDGSVRVKVPANVALQVSILDVNGRRDTVRSRPHNNWLQVQPGQVLTCNGCHTPTPTTVPATPGTSHGRLGAFAAANQGMPSNSGVNFPNTVAALFGAFGQTMAQVRAERMCALSIGSSACNPSVDLVYYDYWTDPIAAGRAADASFDYCYAAGPTDVKSDAADTNLTHSCVTSLVTPAPIRSDCETNWSSNCRIIINYVTHIQPLWDINRFVDPLDVTVNSRCTSCHSPLNDMNAAMVPAGQLDLSGTQDTNQPDHLTSYRKLLFAHNAQELDPATMTALQDICLQRDPVTDVCIQTQSVSAPMNALNARGSRFFTTMSTAGTTVDHRAFMTSAELRLISEWLDIGAQYYNDPFLAPTN